MFCQHCNQKTESGRFCTNCGKELVANESAATSNPITEENISEASGSASPETTQQSNEFTDQIKDVSSNFGKFFMTLMKKPSEAKNVNSTHLYSSIILMVVFSLLIALNTYISESTQQSWYDFGSDWFSTNTSISFVDYFLIPLVKYVILFGILATLTFAATKLVSQQISFKEIIAKFGGYLVPFLLLYVLGILFSLIKLGFPFTIVYSVSLLAPSIIVPILILTEKPVKGFDLVYVIIGLSIVTRIVNSYLSSSGGFGF